MRRVMLIVTLLAPGLLLGASLPAIDEAAAGSKNVVQRPDLLREFDAAGTTGTMVLAQSGEVRRTVVVGSDRSRVRRLWHGSQR